jgi:3-oxoacyl-[acyl-carrier-protein] synthase III
VNPDDPVTAGLFGDGAGAVVVGAPCTTGPTLLASKLFTYSEGATYCQVRSGGTRLHPLDDMAAFLGGVYFEMDGKPTYRLAAERFPSFLETLLADAGVRPSEVDIWVPHQASGRAVGHLAQALGIPSERMVLTLPTRGNQISASMPVALNAGIRDGRIRSGSLVALVGSGAGISFGGAILRY